MNDKFIDTITDISDSDLTKAMCEYELYEKKSYKEILEEIDGELVGESGALKTFVIPAFSNIIAEIGKTYNINMINKLMASGVTLERLFCDFSYDDNVEAYRIEEAKDIIRDEKRMDELQGKYDRSNYLRQSSLINYSNKKFNGNKTIKSEVGNNIVYQKKEDLNNRNFNKKSEHMSNVDHVVPLKEMFYELESNPALNEKDYKDICNIEDNLMIIDSSMNCQKKEMTNSEYVNKYGDKLSDETKEKLLEAEKFAYLKMAEKQNEIVLNKIIGKPTNVQKDSKNYEEALKSAKIQQKEVAINISKATAKHAVERTKEDLIGYAIILMTKAAFFEIKDSIVNGIESNTNEVTKIAAFGYRMKRACLYVINKFKEAFSTSILEIIKNIAKAFLKVIVDMFAGIIKSIGRIVVNGIGAIVKAIKILLAPSSEMSYAEKADAIVKIVGSMASIFIGEIIDRALSTIGIPEFINKAFKVITSGFSVALIGYSLDKMDLFSAKKEVRLQRIDELFDMRIKEIHNNVTEFIDITNNIMDRQVETLKQIKSDFIKGIINNDIQSIEESIEKFRGFSGVTLNYSNEEEFEDFLFNGELAEI